MWEENKNLLDTGILRKEFINKILIFGTLVFTVIIIATISGILMAKSYNEKTFAKYYSQVEDTSKEENTVEEEVIKQEISKEQFIPVYSENAKNRMNNIYVSEGGEKIAYLTFDDGPSSNVTPQILQILQNEGVKATFFVLGSRVELYPELLKQEYDAGHYIANHGYSHNYSSIYSSPNAVLDEFNRTETLIKQVLGNENYSSHLFRFPGGSSGGKYAGIKKSAMQLLDENNIAHINWNSLTNDSVGKPTAESIVDNFKSTSQGKNKLVVLMHDSGTKQLTADTLGIIISYLKQEGFSFKNFYDIMCE